MNILVYMDKGLWNFITCKWENDVKEELEVAAFRSGFRIKTFMHNKFLTNWKSPQKICAHFQRAQLWEKSFRVFIFLLGFFSTHLAIKQMQIEDKAFFTLLFHFWLFNSAFYGYLRAIEAATTNDANKKIQTHTK